MSVESKWFFGEILRSITYRISPRTILLDQFQYIHVQDRNSGAVVLHQGPAKVRLKSHQQIIGGVNSKISVSENQYVVILNPYQTTRGDIAEGEREIRVGPILFALHPGEEVAKDASTNVLIRDEHLLKEGEGLLLRAIKNVPHPVETNSNLQAGDEYLLKGPRRYVPDKDIEIVEPRKALSLSADEGVYVQNYDTGEVRLVKGPADLFLEANETLWEKYLSDEELQALGYKAQQLGQSDIRVLSSMPRPLHRRSDAIVISLEDNEAIYLYEGDSIRVEFGPKTVFLQPAERPKVLFISGGVPLRPNALRLAKLSLGRDFIRDRIVVRTKDNATLTLDVTYRWRFEVDLEHPEKLFILKDFIGFAAQTLSAEIRGEAARHDFEAFHSDSSTLITKAVFAEASSRRFDENGLIIFGVDVETVTPQEDQISEKLSTAILSNVEIYTQTTREKANLTREGELIIGRVVNEEKRQQLIELESENKRQEILRQAQAQNEAAILNAQTEAEVIQIKAQAERDAEINRLQAIIALLDSEGGKAYIQLEQAHILKATDKVIVPTDSRIHLNTLGNGTLHDD